MRRFQFTESIRIDQDLLDQLEQVRDRRRLEHRSDAHRIALEVGLAHLLGGKPATLAERVADVERRIAELQSVLLGGDDPIEHPMPRVVPPPDQWLTVNNKETS